MRTFVLLNGSGSAELAKEAADAAAASTAKIRPPTGMTTVPEENWELSWEI